MKRVLYLLIISVLIACQSSQTRLNYPVAKKVDTVDTYFGMKIADPYRWLENDTSAETAQWVKAQNDVTFSYLQAIPFRDKIKERLTKIWNYEKVQSPKIIGNKIYYFKNNGLQNQSILYVADIDNKNPKIFLDPNKLSEDGTVALTNYAFSKDHNYFAYSVSHSGSDWNEIFVKNAETGEELKDHLKWVKFSEITWYKDGFFYSCYDEPKKGKELSNVNEFQKIYYHKIGTSQKEDKLTYENKNEPKRTYQTDISEDEKLLYMYETASTSGNALYYKDLSKQNSTFIKLANGFDNNFIVIDNEKDQLLVITNYKTPKNKVISIDLNRPDSSNWKDIIPEKEFVLESCEIANGKLITNYLKDVHSVLEVYDLTGKFLNEIKLPDIGSVEELNCWKNEKTAYYSFSTYNIPTTIFKYDLTNGQSEVFFKPDLDFDGTQYETRQVFYTSKDGTKIPLDIVCKKGIELNSENPVMLYGYGGFNVTLNPDFKISRVIWLENGGIYACAHLRGGGEYGEEWHKAGTKLKKQNVFDDFIAAAEYLVKEKYTNPSKIAIMGGSNGGLLIGAVGNQRPDLFKVAIPIVGVMDMLRYHKFTIGWAWATDYGRSDDSIQFNNLIKYSPIHTIKSEVEYPATLVITADHDDRVVPAHSFKYIATLQEKYKGNNPVIIRIETKAGHGAGKSTALRIEEAADIWAFTFKNMGIKPNY